MLQIEIAGTVIQFEDTEAALVIYFNEQWKNTTIKLEAMEGNYLVKEEWGPVEKAKVKIIGRSKGDKVIYSAIFPRISLGGKATDKRYFTDTTEPPNNHLGYHDVDLFAGNITEIDLTDEPYQWKTQ